VAVIHNVAFARSRSGDDSERVHLADLEDALGRTRPSISPEMQASFDERLATYERV
jgi:hypothetical protein